MDCYKTIKRERKTGHVYFDSETNAAERDGVPSSLLLFETIFDARHPRETRVKIVRGKNFSHLSFTRVCFYDLSISAFNIRYKRTAG